jgi:hypothetical protein
MRLSATQAATGALTAAVVAGMLLLPGHLLGTDSGDRTVITLPVTTAPAPVQAAALVVRKPARKPRAKPAPAGPRPVHAATLVSQPTRTAPVVHHAAATRSSGVRSALLTRLVRSKAVRAALAGTAPAKHKHAPDPVLPTAPAPAPAPAPPTTTAAQPTIVASVEQPAPAPTPAPTPAPAPTADGLRQAHHDDDRHAHDPGRSPWDGHGHWR